MSKTIEDTLDVLNDRVRKNVVIVDNTETPTSYMLHIGAERSPKYIPRIGHRQGNSEDRTVARVTVSPYLAGCFIGYGSMLSDFFHQNTLTGKNELQDWKGGFYINKLPFEKALVPNNKLVYDQSATAEHWLISYSEETREYKSEMIGKVVFDSVTMTPVANGSYEVAYSLFIEVKENLYFNPETLLEPGFYSVKLTHDQKSTYKNTKSVISPITMAMYKERKAIVANNLSVNNAVYSKW